MKRKSNSYRAGLWRPWRCSARCSPASAARLPPGSSKAKHWKGPKRSSAAAIESALTIPGLTTKCENFLYKLKIENEGGTGKGEVTEMPLYNCTTEQQSAARSNRSGPKHCRGHRN